MYGNKTVLIYDLTNDNELYFEGKDEDVFKNVNSFLEDKHIDTFLDFGGVASLFLQKDKQYLQDENIPELKNKNSLIYSFTPKNKWQEEKNDMIRTAKKAGFKYMILLPQKHGKYGKVWLLENMDIQNITYYEDTAEIIDELKDKNAKFSIVHIHNPEFEMSKKADEVLSQEDFIKTITLKD